MSSTPFKKSNDCAEKEEYYKYVPHHQQKKWEALGWSFHCDLGPPHAAYSSLYKWMGSGQPIVPDDSVQITKNIDMEIDSEANRELRCSSEET